MSLILASLLVGTIFVTPFTLGKIAYAHVSGDSSATGSETNSTSTSTDTNSTSYSSFTNSTSAASNVRTNSTATADIGSQQSSANVTSTTTNSTSTSPDNITSSDSSTVISSSNSTLPIDSKVTLEHSTIEINTPVEWVQTVTLSNATDAVKVEIPADAQKVSVVTTDGQQVSNSTIVVQPAAQNIAAPDSAPVVSLDDVSAALQQNATTKLVAIDQPSTGYNITYETPAPYTIESEQFTSDLYQKNVTVTHDSAFHYTDVKSYSKIPENLVSKGIQFKLFWMVDGVKTDVTSDLRFAVTFVDTDGNGIADQMQWVIPQLSEQQFVIEGVILTTAAEHLDANRSFVANVYNQTKSIDGVLTDPIPAGEYIRATFEQHLDSSKSIEIYATSTGSNSSVQLYENDSNVLIGSWQNITQNRLYELQLGNYAGYSDTFDLKVVGYPVQFDYIQDAGSLTLSPASGPVGTSVQVTSGGGVFTKSCASCITVKYDVSTVGTGGTNNGGNINPAVTFIIPSSSVGGHTVSASDGTTTLSTTFTATQGSTTTAITASANPSVFGQSVTFTATVTRVAPATLTPTGIVTFKDGATTIGTGTVSASSPFTASFSTSSLSVATHSITAVYGGDTNFSTSTSSALSQVVNRASTGATVTTSGTPSVYGQAVTFTTTITIISPGSGTPAGTVTFNDGATTLGISPVSGSGPFTAVFSTSALTVGPHGITATYNGDGNFNSSSASPTLTQTVNPAPSTTTLASSLNPSIFGQSVTFTATVTSSAGTPTGTVTFKDGATTLGTSTLDGSGHAAFSTSSLSIGSHSITAVYGGDTNFAASTSSALTQTINSPSTTTLVTSSTNPSTFGQSVTFAATVSPPAATGTVQFKIDGVNFGSVVSLSSGSATSGSVSSLFAGSHTITAVYSGDSTLTGSTGTLSQTVSQAGTATTISSSATPSVYGQTVTFTAIVSAVSPGSGMPTGTVTFNDGATTIGSGSLDGSGHATFIAGSLAFGPHSITANYGGDTNFAASTSSALTQTVNKASTTTTISCASPVIEGIQSTCTIAVIGSAPTGTVDTFTSTGSGSFDATSCTLIAGSCSMHYTPSNTAGSPHLISATYEGDANNAASISTGAGLGSIEVSANYPPVVDAGAVTATINEGDTFARSGSFTDTTSTSWTATVDYGDGGGPISLALNLDKTFNLGHTYADNGIYTLTVTITDNQGASGSAAIAVTVNNTAPVVNAGNDVSSAEGTSVSLDAATSFSDLGGAGDAPFAISIDWGDSSAPTIQTASSPGGIAASHTYADNGIYTITVSVTDKDGSTGTDTATATISNVAPVVSALNLPSGNEGSQVTLAGTVSDAGTSDAPFTININWGDTSPTSTMTVNTAGSFAANHVYADNGAYAITVTATDKDSGTSVAATTTAAISNVAPTISGLNSPSGDEGAVVTLTGMVDDAGSSDGPFATNINWGDSFNTTITVDPKGTFSASHTYADNGNYAISVTAADKDNGASIAATASATISNVNPTVNAGGALSADEGSSVSLSSASFTDPAGTGDATYNIDIDWGDSSTHTIQTASSPSAISASHTYADNGAYTVTIKVTDKDGGIGSSTTTATISNVSPTVNADADASVNEGSVFAQSGSFSDPGTADTWTATVDYDDGTGPHALSLSGSNSFTLSHTYPTYGVHTVTVTVTDDDGGIGIDTIQVTINNVAPTLTMPGSVINIDEGTTASFTATSTDPGSPPETLTFSLVGAPAAAVIDPSTGAFSWATGEADGPNSYAFSVHVSDGSLTDTKPVTINVDEVNVAPVLTVPGAQTVKVGSLLTFTVSATDADLPANTLTYTATGLPSGASFDGGTRTFTWTPGESPGPGDYAAKIRVTDNGVPSMYDEKTVSIHVDKMVTALTLNNISDAPWGTAITITGKLANADGLSSFGVGGKTITFTATGPSVPIPASATTSTISGHEGEFTTTITVPQAGSYSVTAHFAGTAATLASDSSTKSFSGLIHATKITLDSIPAQPWGASFAVSGALMDLTVPSNTISGITVTLSSISGTTFATGTPTVTSGTYSTTVTAPSAVTSETITASFAGLTNKFSSAPSDSKTFNLQKHPTKVKNLTVSSSAYSDPVNTQASLVDNLNPSSPIPLPGKSIGFSLGTQSGAGTTNTSGVASAIITLNQPATTPTTSSTASFAGDSLYKASTDSLLFTIAKEDATLDYTGDMVVPTTATSVTLRALLTQADDGSLGDVTKAKVLFEVWSTSLTPTRLASFPDIPVTAIAGDPLHGVASLTATLPQMGTAGEDTYLIVVRLDPAKNQYFQANNTDSPFTVYTPSGQFTTGGGWITDSASNNGHGNFGFNVKYKNNNIQGKSIFVWRGTYNGQAADYIIKSTSWTGLAISQFTGSSSTTGGHSTFQGKAVLQINDAATGASLYSEGNWQFTVIADDHGTPGKGIDYYKITVLDKNGITNHVVDGYLQGGNIEIHQK